MSYFAGNKVPKEMKKLIRYKFPDASAVDRISCDEPAYSDFKASFKAGMTNHFACLNASSSKKSEATVNVDKCSQAGRKKRATGQDITLEFTLAIDDATAANLQAFIDDNVGKSFHSIYMSQCMRFPTMWHFDKFILL